jgi:hypothetical protein
VLKNVSNKVADRNFKLARPRQLPDCPNGHGYLVPTATAYACIDCGHTQPRTPSTRTAPPAEATDLTHHLRQADAPEEIQNEKGNNGPAGNSGGRGRAISGGENNSSIDADVKKWIEEEKIMDRERYRSGRWS